jgi:peptide deformylase
MTDPTEKARVSQGPSQPFDLRTWLSSLGDHPPIVQAGARVLRHRAESVPSSLLATPALRDLVRVMTDVMRRAPGVGLAAPQIGVPLRVFVAEDLEERIADLPDGTAALVSRWQSVSVRGVDAEGRPVSLHLDGWPARIMQHEFDHLEGILYVDRMMPRSFATETELPRLSAMPVADAQRELGIEPGE